MNSADSGNLWFDKMIYIILKNPQDRTLEEWTLIEGTITKEDGFNYPLAQKAYKLKNSKLRKVLE